ncbi:TPA: FAD-dependent oxidoreductase [Elizabethkingia anophelis]
MNRDGAKKSIWQEEIKEFDDQKISHQVFDVAIVGAGITGITTALEFQKENMNCILLEASNIGFGTTGGTTAHLNDFFDTPFHKVIENFGSEKAMLYAKAGQEAIAVIEENIENYKIDCDFERKVAYLFALDKKQSKNLKEIKKGMEDVGHLIYDTNEIPFPIDFEKAVVIPNQAQFHPVKYIKALCNIFIKKGGVFIQNALVERHEEKEDEVSIYTVRGLFKARYLIYATHIPPGINSIHFMTAPYRSYVIACRLKDNSFPKVLGYDLNESYHYYRFHLINGENLLIAGGEDHKTGHEEDTNKRFEALEDHIRKYFKVKEVVYSWSSQYYETLDGLAYIGKMPGDETRVYMATGFRGNGMIWGTLSSKILRDLIIKGFSSYGKLFDPERIKPLAGFSTFIKEIADVGIDFIKDKLFVEKIHSAAELENGEAKVVKYEGESYAVFKEKSGELHILKSTCPHAHCEVRWNTAELSWDCPCHGSRFGINGKFLTGPAAKNLQRIFPNPDIFSL